jgi:hypothetical protein
VGPLERLRRLEDARARCSEADDRPEAVSEERRAALRKNIQEAKEQATREALETGDARRLRPLENLERNMRERVESRRRQDES